MLKRLQEKNPELRLYDVSSDEFAEYGRVLTGFDTAAIIREAECIGRPESGTVYLPSVAAFEALDIFGRVREEIFGTLDIQLGYCYGYSDSLNATEWHYSSELNIAVTPLVLILAKRSDLKNNRLDSAQMKAFFVPAGTVLEAYATTLHYCPCQVSDGGFGCVVGLPRGTNTPLDAPVSDPLLFRKNKWILAHDGQKELLAKGVVAGIGGINFKINY